MKNSINVLLALYFIILTGERVQSLIRSGINKVKIANNGFNMYVYTLVVVSLLATLILFVVFFKKIFPAGMEHPNYGLISILAGVILFSGMVHTEYTIPGIQFASYGALIVAMILGAILYKSADTKTSILTVSLVFIVVFSMAIPVMYKSEISASTAFHWIEAIVSVVMVIMFTMMLKNIMTGSGVNPFSIAAIAVAVIGDAVILIMRWKEQVNTFVLIFIVLTAVMWAVGRIMIAASTR